MKIFHEFVPPDPADIDQVVLDIDGCLWDFRRAYLDRFLSHYHDIPDDYDSPEWSFWREFGQTDEEFRENLLAMRQIPMVNNMPWLGDHRYNIEGIALEVLHWAFEKGKPILFLTSRPSKLHSVTSDWLLERFGMHGVFCGVDDKGEWLDIGGYDPGRTIVVEDSPEQIADYQKHGFRPLSPTYAYNQSVLEMVPVGGTVRQEGDLLITSELLDLTNPALAQLDSEAIITTIAEDGHTKLPKPSALDVLRRWPRAILAISELCIQGDLKYEHDGRPELTRGAPLDQSRYDADYSLEKGLRHIMRAFGGEEYDAESGVSHTIPRAWHVLNELENELSGFSVDDIIERRHLKR